jgi:hypothetical protein
MARTTIQELDHDLATVEQKVESLENRVSRHRGLLDALRSSSKGSVAKGAAGVFALFLALFGLNELSGQVSGWRAHPIEAFKAFFGKAAQTDALQASEPDEPQQAPPRQAAAKSGRRAGPEDAPSATANYPPDDAVAGLQREIAESEKRSKEFAQANADRVLEDVEKRLADVEHGMDDMARAAGQNEARMREALGAATQEAKKYTDGKMNELAGKIETLDKLMQEMAPAVEKLQQTLEQKFPREKSTEPPEPSLQAPGSKTAYAAAPERRTLRPEEDPAFPNAYACSRGAIHAIRLWEEDFSVDKPNHWKPVKFDSCKGGCACKELLRRAHSPAANTGASLVGARR